MLGTSYTDLSIIDPEVYVKSWDSMNPQVEDMNREKRVAIYVFRAHLPSEV